MQLVAKKAAVPADGALARALSHMDADEAHQSLPFSVWRRDCWSWTGWVRFCW